MTRDDDRNAAGNLFDDEMSEGGTLGQRQKLHLARLGNRKQGVGALLEIPFNQAFQTQIVNFTLIGEWRQHYGNDAFDLVSHLEFSIKKVSVSITVKS
jgi:hypothetical protein